MLAMKRVSPFLILLLACAGSSEAYSGRYTLSAPVATEEQRDLLSVVTEIQFPSSVTNIGDAMDTLLHPSGYQLASLGNPYLGILLDLPLPAVHRRLGPITIENALQTLAGEPFQPVFDPVRRLVSFELKSAYLPAPASAAINPAPGEPAGSSLTTSKVVLSGAPVTTEGSSLLPQLQDVPVTGAPSFSNSSDVARHEPLPPSGQPSPVAPAPALSPDDIVMPSRSWQLSPGQTLRSGLEGWADEAGWSVVWDLNVDYDVEATITLTGSFIHAVSRVVRAYCENGVPLGFTSFPGNRVLKLTALESVDGCAP